MDLIIALVVSAFILVFSVVKGYFIAYPLLLSLLIFIGVLHHRGFSLKSLIVMAVAGSQKSFTVLSILLLIGAVTAVWMAAGTVPALVYYGIKVLNPRYFILWAFILTSCISTLLGTSFGTVGTMGVALMIMAKGSGVNPDFVAGAIIAGAYFGDRCSPMSSSANLIAGITRTKLYINIRNMIFTSWLPLIASFLFYLILSLSNPIYITDKTLVSAITKSFNVNPLVLLPALAIIIFSLFKIEVKISLSCSLIIGLVLGFTVQGYSFVQLVNFALFGFNLEKISVLTPILKGGGVASMMQVSIIVIISTAFAGIIGGTRMLEVVEIFLQKASSRSSIFVCTILIGLASAVFGCTQTIAILLTQQLVQEKYQQAKLNNYQLANDLENTVVVLSPLIPWNIAGLVPATMLMTDSGFIPYASYLYFLPLFNLIQFKLNDFAKLRSGNKLKSNRSST